MGKYGSSEKRPVIKLTLNVIISCLAALWKCIPGGYSWKLMFLDLSYFWKAIDASFSSLVYDDLIPLAST